jgi:hypothetical protein
MLNEIIYVDVDDINYFHTEWSKRTFTPELLKEPDWDRDIRPVIPDLYDVCRSFRSMYQIFKEGRPYTKCDEYVQHNARIRSGLPPKPPRWNTRSRIDALIRNHIAVFRDIRDNGYKTQKELGGKELDEIWVVMDRFNRLIKIRGSANHRFAMAKLLKLNSVPVYVAGVYQ